MDMVETRIFNSFLNKLKFFPNLIPSFSIFDVGNDPHVNFMGNKSLTQQHSLFWSQMQKKLMKLTLTWRPTRFYFKSAIVLSLYTAFWAFNAQV